MTDSMLHRMSDEQLDRMIGQVLTARAEDVAAVAIPHTAMADRIAQRLPETRGVAPSMRLVVILALVALLLVASVIGLVIGSRPQQPSVIIPPPSASVRQSASPEPTPTVEPIRFQSLANVCGLQFQQPLAEALDIAVVAEPQTPPDMPEGGVCQLSLSAGSDDLADYVGNIHVFQPPAAEDLQARAQGLIGASTVGDANGTPIFIGTEGCEGGPYQCAYVLIADDQFLVMLLVTDNVVAADEFTTAMQGVAEAVVEALDAGEVGVAP